MKQVKELTAQQIFEKVAKHLAKQGKKCLTPEGACCNFGTNEMRCAVACLVPRKIFRGNREIRIGGILTLEKYLKVSGVDSDKHFVLLKELQQVHDHLEISNWPSALKAVAHRHDLTVPEWLAQC